MYKTIRTFRVKAEFSKRYYADQKFAKKWGRFGAFKWGREFYNGYRFTMGRTIGGGE